MSCIQAPNLVWSDSCARHQAVGPFASDLAFEDYDIIEVMGTSVFESDDGLPERKKRILVDDLALIPHFVREHYESMKPPANVKTPEQYIASLPAERAKTIATVRALVNQHIPRGFDECLVWGTIGWTIPLSRYPDTYNKQPICYVALSSQKNYCVLYLMGAYWSASQLEQLKAAFKAAGKKLNMGKCCVSFKSPDDLPLEAIGKLISETSSEQWIEFYEQSRLRTKAGQAQMAKQGAPTASKVAAKRVDTKRRR